MPEGKKNRKVGRSKRKPADQNYKALGRREANKRRHVAAHDAWVKVCARAREAFRKRYPNKPAPHDIGRLVRCLRKGDA